MNKINPQVDGFLRKATRWQKEFTALRKIALDCGLTEEVRWRWPCYTFDHSNIVLIHGFKEYCAFLFFKGALLKDTKHVLVKTGPNTQVSRQARFTDVGEIVKLAPVLKAYIREAIVVDKSGVKVKLKKSTDYEVAAEFQQRLDDTPGLKAAFAALTPGRQRLYLVHFSSAKQSKTRESRVEKCIPRILDGKGLDD